MIGGDGGFAITPSLDSAVRDAYVAARAEFLLYKSIPQHLERKVGRALRAYGDRVEAAVQQSDRFQRVGVHGSSIVYGNAVGLVPGLVPITDALRQPHNPNSLFFVVNAGTNGEGRYQLKWDKNGSSILSGGISFYQDGQAIARQVALSHEDSLWGNLLHVVMAGGSVITAGAGGFLALNGVLARNPEFDPYLNRLDQLLEGMMPSKWRIATGALIAAAGLYGVCRSISSAEPLCVMRGGDAVSRMEQILLG